MNKILACLALLVGLVVYTPTAHATCNVKSAPWSAVGDGIVDDRVALQKAILDCAAAGGSEVYFPAGTYIVSVGPFGGTNPCGSPCGLMIPSGMRIRGQNVSATVIKQAPGTRGSARLLHVYGDDTAIEDLTLDGNKEAQTRIPTPGAEHRHGIFAINTKRLKIRNITSRNFTGDGVYLFTGSRDTSMIGVTLIDNDRSGVALAQDLDGFLLTGSLLKDNGVQQIDTEPVHPANVNDVTISGNIIDGSNTNSYAITISGPHSYNQSEGYSITGNVIKGPIFVVWANNVAITGNRITNHTTKSAVDIYRTSNKVVVVGNAIVQAQVGAQNLPAIAVTGTGEGHLPEDVLIQGNTLTVVEPTGWGVRIQGVLTVSFHDNVVIGSGLASTFGAGVYLRASHLSVPPRYVSIQGNTFRNFGRYGVLVSGNVDGTGAVAHIDVLKIADNYFEDTSLVATMTTGIKLDDGTDIVSRLSVRDNFCMGGVSVCVASLPTGAVYSMPATPGNSGWVTK